jgi:hypothetical protein
MTDILPPPVVAPDPTETAPESSSHRWIWAGLGVAVLACVAGAVVALAHPVPVASAPAVDQHGNVACTPDVAEAYPDARDGVAVIVHAPGPAVVSIAVSGGIDRGGFLTQQVTKRSTGAQFDFPQATPVSYISISINRNLNVTSCYVPIPDGLGYP